MTEGHLFFTLQFVFHPPTNIVSVSLNPILPLIPPSLREPFSLLLLRRSSTTIVGSFVRRPARLWNWSTRHYQRHLGGFLEPDVSYASFDPRRLATPADDRLRDS